MQFIVCKLNSCKPEFIIIFYRYIFITKQQVSVAAQHLPFQEASPCRFIVRYMKKTKTPKTTQKAGGGIWLVYKNSNQSLKIK